MSTEKKLTAMQELIFDISRECKTYYDNNEIYLKSCIEAEKQQIIDAYDTGYSDGLYENGLDTGKEYFKQTFKK